MVSNRIEAMRQQFEIENSLAIEALKARQAPSTKKLISYSLQNNPNRKNIIKNDIKLDLLGISSFGATLGYIASEKASLFPDPITGALSGFGAVCFACGITTFAASMTRSVRKYQAVISENKAEPVPMHTTLKLLAKDLFSGNIKE